MVVISVFLLLNPHFVLLALQRGGFRPIIFGKREAAYWAYVPAFAKNMQNIFQKQSRYSLSRSIIEEWLIYPTIYKL